MNGKRVMSYARTWEDLAGLLGFRPRVEPGETAVCNCGYCNYLRGKV